MKQFTLIFASLSFCCLIPLKSVATESVPYGVGDWNESFGNHRALVNVAERAEAVRLHIPWRRRDARPEAKEIIVIDAATNKRVTDVLRVNINRESGDLLFRPATVPGNYHVYYMPYKNAGSPYFPSVVYSSPTDTAAVDWKNACEPLAKRILANDTAGIAKAKVLEIQAINEFHRFDPMEVVATAKEMQNLLSTNTDKPYLLFPEDRRHPIRMNNELPLRWITKGPGNTFQGEACRGEYYVFQVGVYASRQTLKNMQVQLSQLTSGEHTISPGNTPCLNTGGVDCFGQAFTKKLDVDKGRVQALWLGVQVPKDAIPGLYQGDVTIAVDGMPDTKVHVSLTVTDTLLKDAGDGDLWRLSRLRWLNSTIGLDDNVFEPFTPVTVDGQTVSILGRNVRIAGSGLFNSIQSTFGASVDRTDAPPRELLAAPMKFVVETAAGPLPWTYGKPAFTSKTSGAVSWETTNRTDGLELHCRAKMECDGYVNYYLTLRATKPLDLKDVRLEIPMRPEVAKYMMGLGRKGGYRPDKWQWKWDINHSNNQLWLGDVNAGLQCKLKHTEPRWDMFNLKESGTYKDWSNNGQGGFNVEETGGQVVTRAYTGPRKMTAGQDLHFNFGLLITPLKVLDKQHWQWRYFHSGVPTVDDQPVDKLAAKGVKITNIHHGNSFNPHINYPFVASEKLSTYIKQAHAKDIKVKMYYTVRELSNYAAEFWPLRSLGNEVFTTGPGFRLADLFEDAEKRKHPRSATGSSWLCEHAIDGYVPAWHHYLGNGHYDASIATAGITRWHNYYLEGLAWLLKEEMDADGLYLDGIGYDREIMKRVRKVMQRSKPGCLIDFHNGNHFAPQYGMNNISNFFMELFPYMDSLWLGEGFNYNESPDYWLVEMAGIPYGMFGEMLGAGNPWRGMVYGMSNRLGWGGDPQALWKVWDEFGIQDARLIGYWDPACPVKTGTPQVLATAYVKQDKTLIAIASWAHEETAVKLTLDWKALGLDPANVSLRAPSIAGFQDEKIFRIDEAVPVKPGKGWLLELNRKAVTKK